MKKIALIEDRHKRQEYFLEQISLTLSDYKDILENFIEEKASNLLPIRNWSLAISQLAIHFEGRLDDALDL